VFFVVIFNSLFSQFLLTKFGFQIVASQGDADVTQRLVKVRHSPPPMGVSCQNVAMCVTAYPASFIFRVF